MRMLGIDWGLDESIQEPDHSSPPGSESSLQLLLGAGSSALQDKECTQPQMSGPAES